jgi:hypothetical protein
MTTIPQWDGWHLIGRFPDEDDGVGSWILHYNGEAALLEVPPGLTVYMVVKALKTLGGLKLKHIFVSHKHEDHYNRETCRYLQRYFGIKVHHNQSDKIGSKSRNRAKMHDSYGSIGGEQLWLIGAPKHSPSDVIVAFRGVAMTGDIELGMVKSVNDEVSEVTKRKSMQWFSGFEERTGYHIHSIVSAHLNDVRTDVNWSDLFAVGAHGNPATHVKR